MSTTVGAEPTFTEAMQRQCGHMIREAKRLDEKGYAIITLYASNNCDGRMPHTQLAQSFNKLLKDWKQKHRRRAVTIHIVPDRLKMSGAFYTTHYEYNKGEWELDLAKHPFKFTAYVPRTTRLRPIVATLELMSRLKQGRDDPAKGAGELVRTELASHFEFEGEGRESLKTLIAVLDMPHHQEALLRR